MKAQLQGDASQQENLHMVQPNAYLEVVDVVFPGHVVPEALLAVHKRVPPARTATLLLSLTPAVGGSTGRRGGTPPAHSGVLARHLHTL